MVTPVPPPAPCRPGRPTFGMVAALLAASAMVAVLRPDLAAWLLAAQTVVGLLILLAALVPATSERAFRLLRWMVDRPEPAAPPQAQAAEKALGERGGNQS